MILRFLLILLLLAPPVFASDSWDGDDKLYHLTAGTIIGLTVYAVNDVENPTDLERNKFLSGVVWSFYAGLAKESFDFISHGAFSTKDLTMTVAGGIIGSSVGVSVTYIDGVWFASRSWEW